MMATNAKRESPENPEASELEVLKAKIRKLETTVKAKTEELLLKDEELMSKTKELQMIKNDQVDHHESQENEVVDILLVFMDNTGFKRIADKILYFLDCKSFLQSRLVCRSWKDFIDNEWSMLQLQIFHLKRHPNEISEYDGEPYHHLLNEHHFHFGPLIKIMEKNTNKSELRVFINMCREMAPRRLRKLEEDPLQYMIDHHRHQELKMLLDYPVQLNQNGEYYGGQMSLETVFKYACQYGCEICVKLLLDLTKDKEIDLNLISKRDYNDNEDYGEDYRFEHCLFAACWNGCKKEILDLLLCSAEERGINIHAKDQHTDWTLREIIITDFEENGAEIEEYTEATYKILKIDPSVDLKQEQ